MSTDSSRTRWSKNTHILNPVNAITKLINEIKTSHKGKEYFATNTKTVDQTFVKYNLHITGNFRHTKQNVNNLAANIIT